MENRSLSCFGIPSVELGAFRMVRQLGGEPGSSHGMVRRVAVGLGGGLGARGGA